MLVLACWKFFSPSWYRARGCLQDRCCRAVVKGLAKKDNAVRWDRADCDVSQESFPVKSFFEKTLGRGRWGAWSRGRWVSRRWQKNSPGWAPWQKEVALGIATVQESSIPANGRSRSGTAKPCPRYSLTVAFASCEPGVRSASLSLFIPNFGTILCCTLCCQKATALCLSQAPHIGNMTV